MINNKKFLKYLKENCPTNMNFIKSIRFNNKSISVKVEDKQFFFNEFYTKKSLYNDIINYLISYVKDNDIDFPTDKDFLTYKFAKLNVR